MTPLANGEYEQHVSLQEEKHKNDFFQIPFPAIATKVTMCSNGTAIRYGEYL